MTTLQSKWPTLLDVTSRLDPKGSIAQIGELLSQTNMVLDDMPWFEGNLQTGHQFVVRTSLPSPTWRKYYGGVQPTKSTTAKATVSCGMMEAYAETDKALADLNGNTNEFLLSEAEAHIEGMGQELGSTLFFGNEATTPEEITGFLPLYNSSSNENDDNVITSGTTPDRSFWLVGWGKNKVFGVYPKGSKAGLQMNKKGQVTIENVDGSGGRMEAYRTHFRWDCGLCIQNWKYVVRGQVDISELVKNAATGPDLVDLMMQAYMRLPSTAGVRPIFYADRTIIEYLWRQIVNKTANSTLSQRDITRPVGDVVPVPAVLGIPVHRVDALATTETAYS